jgi:hypothetical protein
VRQIEERIFAADQWRLPRRKRGRKGLKLLSKLAGGLPPAAAPERIENHLSRPTTRFSRRTLGSTRSAITLSSADRPLIPMLSRVYDELPGAGKQLFASTIGKVDGRRALEVYAFRDVLVMKIGMGVSRSPRFEPILAVIAARPAARPCAIPLPVGKERSSCVLLQFSSPNFLVVDDGLIIARFERPRRDPVSAAGPIACVIVLLVFKPLLRRRTADGARLAEEIEGLRMFIATAEKNRLEMTARPDETPQLFETLLPWAFALDAAETWANRFREVLAASQYTPSW